MVLEVQEAASAGRGNGSWNVVQCLCSSVPESGEEGEKLDETDFAF